jgi:HEAT repeat protein
MGVEWTIAIQSVLLVFLVVLFLFWKGSTSELVWQLKHGSRASRMDACRELARMGQAGIVAAPTLKDALDDSDPRVQTMAADALLRMKAWHELNEGNWIPKADPEVVTAAITDLANTFPPPMEGLPILESVVRNHSSADARGMAVFTLGRYGTQAIPALQEAAQDSEPIVRNAARIVLQRIQGSSAQQ